MTTPQLTEERAREVIKQCVSALALVQGAIRLKWALDLDTVDTAKDAAEEFLESERIKKETPKA